MRRSICLFLFLLAGLAYGQTGHFIPSDNFSSGLIADLTQDKYGSIWIATDYGLNRYDGYHFETFLHNDGDPYSMCNNVAVTLLCDKEGHLWVGTNRGLDRFDEATGGFIHYPFPDNILPRVTGLLQLSEDRILAVTAGYGAFIVSEDGHIEPTNDYADEANNQYFSKIFADSRGRIWKTGYDNIVVMKRDGKTQLFQSKGEPIGITERDGEVFIVGVRGIISYQNERMFDNSIDMGSVAGKDVLFSSVGKDADGNIYIGTRGHGLYRIARGSRKLEHYDIDVFGTNMGTAKVCSILSDRKGNLWVAVQRKGLVVVPQNPMQFQNWSFEAQNISLGSSITSVCEGDNNIIWCTVQGVGVYGFDAKGHVVAHPAAPDAVEFIFRDRQSRYWIGTDDGLFAYNPQTGASTLKVNFDCDKFNDMTSDNTGNIYISTFSRGFCVYNPQTGSLKNYRNTERSADRDTMKLGSLCNDWVMCMAPDRDGMIWLGTSAGVSCFDPKTESFHTQGWHQQLSGTMCFSLCELRDGNMAIGTEHGLYLYDRKTRTTSPFPGSEQLNDKTVNYIVQSSDGDIWCSTSMGIWQYDASEKQFIGHVNGNGLNKKEYLYGVGMHTDNDVVYFGNNDGLTVFNPKKMNNKKPTDAADEVMLTGFLVGRTFVNTRTTFNDVQVTDRAVIESNHFTLSYLDHTITLCFSLLNFDNPANVSFEYSVNGGEWVRNVEGVNEVALSHLQPGDYHIKVRALTGNVYSPEKKITVTIRAPWYRTKLAYLLYLLAVLALCTYMFLAYRRRASQQLDEEKMKFLINATHDIRSPLTLIMGPLQHLKRRLTNEEGEAMRDVDTIERNANRILNLVNQILDVRKIDKQQMHLQCQQTDMVTFVGGICKMFEYNAQERGINFSFVHDGIEQLEAWIDRSQFDKVITNLLSNAFKYTQDNGEITIKLSTTNAEMPKLQLQVIDNGVGLKDENLKHIFDRFYQGKNSQNLHVNGTGIGLNLCKMIVDMHHGTIEAQNRTDHNGSIFSVTIPLGDSHLQETEKMAPEAIEQEAEKKSNVAKTTVAHPTRTTRYRILVVDDDQEIGNYISTELSHYYKFTLRPNGKEGLKELLAGDYDLVVSDVMMPEMDGFSMLRLIKTNMNVSHIPVIMLTSKADVGNRLEGLERGADAFLAKPFDMEELHMTIENLIQSRQRLKGKFTGAQQQADKLEQPEVKGNDEQLMERIMKVVNKNLSNSDFNVDMLTQEVGISRAQLHRKMKEMTGIATSEFIRNIRLEQAARLLKEQKINVTQVAYTVGFSNLAHFSTLFRKHFGVSPSEYAEREG